MGRTCRIVGNSKEFFIYLNEGYIPYSVGGCFTRSEWLILSVIVSLAILHVKWWFTSSLGVLHELSFIRSTIN